VIVVGIVLVVWAYVLVVVMFTRLVMRRGRELDASDLRGDAWLGVNATVLALLIGSEPLFWGLAAGTVAVGLLSLALERNSRLDS
jgi:hypothetical protein